MPTPADPFDAVMFDLDGTLLDTLADIAAAGNHVLTTFGLPPCPVADYRYLAGQGARWLVEQALGPDHQHRVDEGVELLKAWQLKHGLDHTRPYDGVPEMLDALTDRNLPLTILSNKPHAATQVAVRERLGRWHFAAVEGARDSRPVKPDPVGAFDIAKRLHLDPSRILYIGDTRADMLTAVAAGMFPLGVLWGFRDERELREAGARKLVGHPGEVVALAFPA